MASTPTSTRRSIILAGAKSRERRIDSSAFPRTIPTQMFNGYGDQVASLYAGMDLKKFY